MKKTIFLVFTLLITAAIILLLLKTQFYHLSLSKKLSAIYENELNHLSTEALKSNDVPVSALLLHNYKIIGRGFNTVIKENNAGAHAEINSISDAIKNLGFPSF